MISSALEGAGGRLQGLAGELREVEGTVSTACGEAGCAAGFPEPAAALNDIGNRWAPALARTSDAVDGAAGALSVAAFVYRFVDADVMP